MDIGGGRGRGQEDEVTAVLSIGMACPARQPCCPMSQS